MRLALVLMYCASVLGDDATTTAASSAPPRPDLLWVTSPTLPGQTVVAVFTGPAPNVTYPMVARLRQAVTGCAVVEPKVDAVDGLSAMFAVPASWPLAVYEAQLCRGGDGTACSSWSAVNEAEPLWAQGDRGAVATRGPTGAPHWRFLPCNSFSHTNLKSPCAEQDGCGCLDVR